MEKETGKVLWFSPEKGFGFIKHPDKKIDMVFVSYSNIESDGFKTLKKGQNVIFELSMDKRGYFAKNVELL
ncbi:MAG: cold shock domain-containing protein [Actinobacteria bacterium]|nr:cold shock domain-containing protein [Actinomycetota bacterium]